MKYFVILLVLVGMIAYGLDDNQAYGCSRDLSHLFWSPIIDRVSGDCSFVGYNVNPSGILFTGLIGFVVAIFAIWKKRK